MKQPTAHQIYMVRHCIMLSDRIHDVINIPYYERDHAEGLQAIALHLDMILKEAVREMTRDEEGSPIS